MSKKERFELSCCLFNESDMDFIRDKKTNEEYVVLDELVPILNQQSQQISDLEAKLAESDAEIEKVEKTYIKQRDYYTKEFNEVIDDLKKQLAEKEEQLNSDHYKLCPRCNNPYGASQFPSKDENGKEIYVCSNCNEKELFYEPLIKQLEDQNDRLIKQRDDANLKLAEKEKEYKESVEKVLSSRDKLVLEYTQDKISFAVEQLEWLKEKVNNAKIHKINMINTHELYEVLDNRITLLKEGR